jgi:[CysO sulfur-carrier protein]-S-L-cysteine hydrolase
MRMTRAHWEELVAHAREDAPNECCGYVRIGNGMVELVNRGTNVRNSPYGYELDSMTHLAAFKDQEDGSVIGMYHSHPRSPAEPSQTDINLAEEPDYLYLIVSLADDEPHVRAWRIADGRVDEEEIEVVG